MAVIERAEAGRPRHFVAHMQDLTERKRVERELEASRAQMVSSSRLAPLGMMAGGVAHGINNPLALIHALAANLLDMAQSGSVQVPVLLRTATGSNTPRNGFQRWCQLAPHRPGGKR